MGLASERRENFLAWMKAEGLNANQIAKQSGVSYTTLRSYLDDGPKGTRSLKGDNEAMIANGFGLSVEDIFGGSAVPRVVPIIGRVGADPDGRIIRTAGQATGDSAPMPTGGTSDAVAVEVDGHSMRGFADDGALVFFENQHTPPTDDMIGDVVVVQLASDGDESDDTDVLIKRLQRGSTDGLYNLESIVGPTLHDVRIRWAAEITTIIPPRQARRLIRRGVA